MMHERNIQTTSYKHLLLCYAEWLRIENYQPKTIKAYPEALKEFFYFLEQQQVFHVNLIEQKHLTGFKNYLKVRAHYKHKQAKIQNRTINSIIKGIHCFVKLFNRNTEGSTLDLYERYLPVKSHEKVILTQDEVMRMYNATFEPYRIASMEMGQRDRVIIAIFYGCGIRLNEGRNLNLSDIDFQNKRILVRKGKGNKERYVPIPNKHSTDLLTYIQQGREWFRYEHYNTTVNKRPVQKKIAKANRDALFLSTYGTRISNFSHRLSFLCDRAGIHKKVSTHTLRHSVATHLLQSGWKLEQISRFLGHASIDSTQIYAHIVESLNQKQDEA